MLMKKFLKVFFTISFAVLVLAACGDNDKTSNVAGNSDGDKLQVVSSFTIITDIVRQIGGDLVDVHNLVPTGTDPHEYEPLPEDSIKATDADILLYNGMNLEGGANGWFFKMLDSVGQDESNAYSLTERVEPMYLTDEQTKEEEINPHTFIDPTISILMTEDMRDDYTEVHPDNKEQYEKNAEKYIEKLKEIDQTYQEKIAEIPEENRTLVTSECAFQYMLDTYGMNEGCIWKVDTEENGSPEQITSLITFLEEYNVTVMFMESNVEPRPMETVSDESGVEIFERPIYSEEISMPGDEVDTYVKYLEYNIDVIHEGLTK